MVTSQFTQTLAFYLSAVKLLCFSCIFSDEDEALFKYLAIILNLNLTASELKHGKYETVILLCSLVLDYEPSNTRALFKRQRQPWECIILGGLFVTCEKHLKLSHTILRL